MLEALGVNIMIPPEKSRELIDKTGICFLFAQKYHTAMKHVAPVRKELGIRTIFNILGPLSNPAGAKMQVLGVFDESLVEPLAKVLFNLGVKNAMVVFGQDRLDVITSYSIHYTKLYDGNRAASSKCGSADVLEALGVNIMIPPEKSRELIDEIGICFLFAQKYHTAMKHVAPVRKELGIRTT